VDSVHCIFEQTVSCKVRISCQTSGMCHFLKYVNYGRDLPILHVCVVAIHTLVSRFIVSSYPF
jgi:hypothetical protein